MPLWPAEYDRVFSKLSGVVESGPGQWKSLCPLHSDNHPSLVWSIGKSGNALVFNCLAGCTSAPAGRAALMKSLGVSFGMLYADYQEKGSKAGNSNGRPPVAGRGKSAGARVKQECVAKFEYRDQAGNLIYEVRRLEPGRDGRSKDFAVYHLNPANGRMVRGMGGLTPILYRLAGIASSAKLADPPPVYIVEGERKADKLAAAGIIATCCPGGAGKWSVGAEGYAAWLRGRHVVILPDNDQPGIDHAGKIAASLAGRAASVKIVQLSGLPAKGDILDWAAITGNSPAKLREIVEATPEWKPGPGMAPDAATAAASPGMPPPTATGSDVSSAATLEAEDDPHRLAGIYVDQYRSPSGMRLRYWRDVFYRRNNTHWIAVAEQEIRAELTRCIKTEFNRQNSMRQTGPSFDNRPIVAKKVTRGIVADVMQAIRGMEAIHLSAEIESPCWLSGPHVARDPRDFIAMHSGILDIPAALAESPEALIQHSPQWFSTTCLPFDFNLKADCPLWLDFLRHNLEGDEERIAMLQEWFGYCLTPDTSQQRFLLMEGEGSNGKSVICAVLAALLGESNVCHVPLEMFGVRFALTQTIGKLANICSEVGELDKVAEGFLKSFTAGDRMTFDRKNKDPVEAMPTARLTLATNNRPRFSDRSGGLWRRMLLLPLRVEITEDRRVPGMDKPEWWAKQGELPGILLWALAGLQQLREYGRFTEAAICRDALRDYRSENNPARRFLLEHFRQSETPDTWTTTKDAYATYTKWCEASGYRPLGDAQFGHEVSRVFKGVSKRRPRINGHRTNVYHLLDKVPTGGDAAIDDDCPDATEITVDPLEFNTE